MAKYIVSKTDGMNIPDDEPVWVFRAKDILALHAIQAYRNLAEQLGMRQDFLTEIDAHMMRIKDWQERYGTKLPD